MAGIPKKNLVSLRLKTPMKPFGYTGILAPLSLTNGVEFPLTPTIQMSHQTSYGQYDVAGSIYQQQYYMNTPNPQISVTAMFASNSASEALYTAAALHFFKACTKSDFGASNPSTAGTPPPILKFNAYGVVHARNVPCVLRSFNYTLPEDTDYVDTGADGPDTSDFAFTSDMESNSVPSLLLVSLELAPQLTPSTVKDEFDIRKFANGNALKGGNSGGFI